MAKKMMSNMMEEVFNSMLQETAKAGELERKIIEDKLFFGDVTDVADADDDADAAGADYLGFSFDMKVKHGKRYNQKINRKNHNKRLYDMRKVSNYAHKNLFDHDEVTQISPVFKHREDEIPSVFIKKGHKSTWEKAYRKVANRKIRYKDRKAVTDYFNEDWYDYVSDHNFWVIAEFYRKNRATLEETFVSMKVAEESEEMMPLMTSISELSEGIHEYKAWITAQIMVCQFDIAWLNGEIEALEIRREQTMKELRDLLG